MPTSGSGARARWQILAIFFFFFFLRQSLALSHRLEYHVYLGSLLAVSPSAFLPQPPPAPLLSDMSPPRLPLHVHMCVRCLGGYHVNTDQIVL